MDGKALVSEASWAHRPNRYSLHLGSACPSPQTSASAMILSPSGLLAVNVRKRGWDLPGGHIEAGETALDAVVREVQEEAGLRLERHELTLTAWAHLELLRPRPKFYAYPYPHTYQPIFTAAVEDDRLTGLASAMPEEISEVRTIPFAEASAVFETRTWSPLLPLLLSIS